MTPEGQIKKDICDYLSLIPNCFFWVNSTTGIFDPKTRRFRKNNSKYQLNGVADILGIYKGKPLAIEVKTKTGKLNENQSIFLDRFKSEGGIAFVARSIEDVINELKR